MLTLYIRFRPWAPINNLLINRLQKIAAFIAAFFVPVITSILHLFTERSVNALLNSLIYMQHARDSYSLVFLSILALFG